MSFVKPDRGPGLCVVGSVAGRRRQDGSPGLNSALKS